MTTKQRANAPVIDPASLPDDVLAKFRGKSHESTQDVRDQRIAQHKRAMMDIVSGKSRKPHRLWKDEEHRGQALFFELYKPKLVAKYPDTKNVMGLPLFQTGKKGFAGMN